MTSDTTALAPLQSLRQAVLNGDVAGLGDAAAHALATARAGGAASPDFDRHGFLMVRACRRLEEAQQLPSELGGASSVDGLREKAALAIDELIAAAGNR